MAKVYLGLGSNLGNRRENLEFALQRIKTFSRLVQVSTLHETPALLPELAPSSWNLPFWNLVAEIDYDGSPRSLLQKLQEIEASHGRTRSDRWAPRTIDLDILIWQGLTLNEPDLVIPHPQMKERPFVMDPLSELTGPKHQSTGRLMGILNITPDSFSDGGIHDHSEALESTLDSWDEIGVPYLDIGAESTRPGSRPLDPTEEWQRLEPVIRLIENWYRGKVVKPVISVDTRHAKTAAKALEWGVEIINDVSGLEDRDLIPVLRVSSCKYILMHSLSIPPNAQAILPEKLDPVREVHRWFEERLTLLATKGISKDRVILDPGIGFGKTAIQSLKLLQQINSFQSLDCLILSGHSRKSFLKDFTRAPASDRDPETLGISFALLDKGVNILRIHNPLLHHRAFLARNHIL